MQPAAYINAAGDVLGFEPEILLMIAKKLDYKVEFIPMEFAALIASVESGKADVCAGSLIITEERCNILCPVNVQYKPLCSEYFLRKHYYLFHFFHVI